MKLKKIHRDAIKYMLDGSLTKDEIADKIGKSRKTLYNWLKDPDFEAEYEEQERQRRAAMVAAILRNARDGVARASKIINESEDTKAVVSMISDMLDRAGFPKLKQMDLAVNASVDTEDSAAKTGIVLIPAKLEGGDISGSMG